MSFVQTFSDRTLTLIAWFMCAVNSGFVARLGAPVSNHINCMDVCFQLKCLYPAKLTDIFLFCLTRLHERRNETIFRDDNDAIRRLTVNTIISLSQLDGLRTMS